MEEIESVRISAAIQLDHIQATGGQREIQNQRVALLLSSKITYRL